MDQACKVIVGTEHIFYIFAHTYSFTFQVCLFIIQLLLLKPEQFRARLTDIVYNMPPEHQLSRDFHQASTFPFESLFQCIRANAIFKPLQFNQVHLDFYKDFPERFTPGITPGADVTEAEAAAAAGSGGQAASACQQSFPIYFSNVCVRFIPVFDIVVHRFALCSRNCLPPD